MAETSLTAQLQKTLAGLTGTQKVMIGSIMLTVILALSGFGVWFSHENLTVLFSNLPPTDANRIVEELKKQNIPYELSSDQRTVQVPETRVGELRLRFAGEGLPMGEGIGFEKLEQPSLTTTDFTQKIMYRRALETHLAKTIRSLQQISHATVHITPANDSPFITEKEDAKASVLLKLKSGRMLPEENTQAIVNLVAAAVEGLKPDNVVIIDQFSRTLSRSGRDPLVGASDLQKKVQREEEDHLVQQVTDLLEPVIGPGKVRATARIELDFDKVKINKEAFDPQGQVERSINQTSETFQKRDAALGIPGTATNVAPIQGAGGNGGILETGEKKSTTTNFEITKTISMTDKAPGSIKRLSLAVILDHHTLWEKDPKGELIEKQQPRSAEELKKIREQVSAAVGIQPGRGDELTVENLPFASPINPREEQEARKQWWIEQGKALLPYIVPTVFGLALFFFLVLPMFKRISKAIKASQLKVDSQAEEEAKVRPRKITHLKTMEEMEAEIEAELNAESATSAPEAQRRNLIKKRIQESAGQDPETAASLVRSWMLEDSGR